MCRPNKRKVELIRSFVGITTDGAKVMVKVGRMLKKLHQLCLAHGIQLAVLSVIYKQTDENPVSMPEQIQSPINCIPDEGDSSCDSDEDDGCDIAQVGRPNQINEVFKPIINKVRSVVKTFKNSPTKNDAVLQKHVKEEFGKELQLILDCPTRWSSLAAMIERFLRLRNCVQKALIDIKSMISFTDEEISMLENLHTSLEIIKTTVEALCRQDSTLLTADTALKLMMKMLKSQEGGVNKRLVTALKQRIIERRVHTVVGTLQYLHNPQSFMNSDTDEDDLGEIFKKPSFEEIKELIINVIVASKKQDVPRRLATERLDITSPGGKVHNDEPLSYKQELDRQLALLHHQQQPNLRTAESDDLMMIINVETAVFESGANRGPILTDVYNKLQSIPPTSVESERAFSASGTICNRIRSRLSDKTLDIIMFLRSIFTKKANLK